MKTLGKKQKAILKELQEKGSWYPGCGWKWDTFSATVQVLDSLVARGLAERTGGRSPEYRPKFATIREAVLAEGRKLTLETDGIRGYRMTGGRPSPKLLRDANLEFALIYWLGYSREAGVKLEG